MLDSKYFLYVNLYNFYDGFICSYYYFLSFLNEEMKG